MDLSMLLVRRDDALVISVPSTGDSDTAAITANLVCRVLFSVIANLVCLVPLRLLYRNGEFAAVVFILTVEILNVETIVKALLWRNGDTTSWWPGYGLCDVDSFIFNCSTSLYEMCLLAIIRNLSHSVGLLRANPLTVKEKRRRNLVQALIMFPLPIAQAAFTWPLTAQRFVVGQLIGCAWRAYASWPFVLLFIVAPMVFAVLTAIYAIMTFRRFREISKTTESALSSNRVASIRSTRTKRRLYLMVMSILVPYLPISIATQVYSIIFLGEVKSFDYDMIHHNPNPFPWNTIGLFPASEIDWVLTNNCYIAIATAAPIFLFFGMTKDALNSYRKIVLAVGLGMIFPKLHEEYDPDKASGQHYLSSSQFMTVTGTQTMTSKSRSTGSSAPLTSTTSSSGGSFHAPRVQSTSLIASSDPAGSQAGSSIRQLSSNLGPVREDEVPTPLFHRNPFLFRTRLSFPIPFTLPFFKSKSKPNRRDQYGPSVPLQPLAPLQPFQPLPHLDEESGPGLTDAHTMPWPDRETGPSGISATDSRSSSSTMTDLSPPATALTRDSHRHLAGQP